MRNLFYSPVAWLVILCYCLVCGYAFSALMTDYFRLQKVMLEGDPGFMGFNGTGLTSELTGPVLGQLVNHLYLFIPLLTMGVINREVHAGTIKLLYSSPLRIREIVLGKYMGLLTLVIMLVLIITGILVSASCIILRPEITRHLASLLAAFLVANAYIAIGLFISAATNYQIVAGVLTFVIFFVLDAISGLWQQYDLIRDITWFLSIAGRADYLLQGLVSTRDLFYFILITVLFLGAAMIRMKSTQESRPWTVSFGRYAMLTFVVLTLGYFSGKPGQVKYWDLTRAQLNTIAVPTQAALKELDGTPLTVTLYTNLLGLNAVRGLPQNRNSYIWHFWERYRRFYPNMRFSYVYYYSIMPGDSSLYKAHPGRNIHQIAEEMAKEYGIRKSLFLTPEQIRRQIDLGAEESRLVMQLSYKGRQVWLRTFNDNEVWPNQEVVAGTICRLTRDSIPAFLFTSGHYERSPYRINERDYGGQVLSTWDRTSLVNLGMDADTINLRNSDIPPSAAALVVADPRSELSGAEQQKISSWLQGGGNALILGEVNKQQMVNPLLRPLGLQLDDGTIVHPNEQEMPHILKVSLTDAGATMAQEESMFQYQRKAIKKLEMGLEGGANISYVANPVYTVEPIVSLKGDEHTWIENGVLVVDSAAPVFAPREGDRRYDEYILGVRLHRQVNNKEQRIVVTGDADMLSVHRRGDIGNAFYSWLVYNRYPFYANYPGPTDVLFTARPGTIRLLAILYKYLIPAAVLIAAIVLLVRRKRK